MKPYHRYSLTSNSNSDNNNNKQQNNNNNDDDNNTAIVPSSSSSSPTTPKKARQQFLKNWHLREFEKLYHGGLTREQIITELKIEKTTYYRYLHALAERERDNLQGEHGNDELWATIGKTRQKFNWVANEMAKRILNKENRWSEETEMTAANLLLEIQAAELRLLSEGPIKTMKELPATIKHTVTTTHYRNGEQEEEQIEIQVEDKEEGEGEEEDGDDSSSTNSK